MNAIDGLLSGLQAAITPTNLLWLTIGCLLGTLVGILPGLGPPATISRNSCSAAIARSC